MHARGASKLFYTRKAARARSTKVKNTFCCVFCPCARARKGFYEQARVASLSEGYHEIGVRIAR